MGKKTEFEPQWAKDFAASLNQRPRVSYGDEDQNDLMSIIDSDYHDPEEQETGIMEETKQKLIDAQRRLKEYLEKEGDNPPF